MIRRLMFWVGLCAVIAACGGPVIEEEEVHATEIDLPSPTFTVSPSSDQAAIIEHDPEAISTIPGPEPVQELLEGIGMEIPGPWLMFRTNEGFGFVSENGDVVRRMQLSTDYYVDRWNVAPHGGLIVIVRADLREKILEVISVKTYETLLSLKLLDYEGEGLDFTSERDAEEFIMDRYHAVGSSSWSSDGSRLAFVSSHLGPSPDVYVYDVLSGAVTRLTSGPTHSVCLHWSPGDQFIFHAGVKKIWIDSSGSGYSGWTFYAARADDSGMTTVFVSEVVNRVHENTVGWFSEDEVLMDSGYWYCGQFDLRIVNIQNGDRASIWPDQFNQIAYDPVGKVALIWVSPEAASNDECGTVGESGLFMVTLPDGRREKLAEFEDQYLVDSIEWVEGTSKFIVDFRGLWVVVDNKGEVEYLDEEPIFSPDGEIIALLGYKGESLHIINEESIAVKVSTGAKILYPVWSPNGSRLFFFEENEASNLDLYMVQSPGYERELIVEDLCQDLSGIPRWVLP